MRASLWTLLVIALAASPAIGVGESPEARGLALARKLEAAADGYGSESALLEMVLVNAHGDRTSRKLRSLQLEVKGDGDRSRIEFEWPADVKGTRMLTWSHKRGNDDQWLFLPAINRVKRISAGNRSGAFMGSEFAYEDLGSQELEKYKHKYLADEALDGRKAWKIERVPVETDSGYSKLVSWFDQEYLNPLKVQYFDRKGELLKTAVFSGYQKHGKWWRFDSIAMTNHQTKKASHLTFRERKLGVSLRDKDFESDELGN